MITCTRIIEFDAGHRVLNHESKCRTVHGHRYKVEITAQGESLDDIGRVIDFSKLKEVIGGWVDNNWDHTMILNIDDPLVKMFQNDTHGYKPPFIMHCNPTAENMALYLLEVSSTMMSVYNISIIKIVIHETPNCKAEATFE